MAIERRKCECGRVYDLLHTERHGYSALDHADMDHLTCPDCDSDAFTQIVSTGSGIDLGGEAGASSEYPRFDRGLGCMVNSRTHRQWLMSHHEDGTPRKYKLRPTDGEDPVGEAYDKAEAARAKREAAQKERQERWNYENREHLPKIARFTEALNKAVQTGQMVDPRSIR